MRTTRHVAAGPTLNRIDLALTRIASDLDGLRLRWALVGGLAVSARVEPRFTRDIDLVIAVDSDDHAERLTRDLQRFGYGVTTVIEQEATGRLAATRLVPPGESEHGVVVDALFASSGIETEVTADADVLDVLPGLRVPVASIGHLIALKVLSRAPGAGMRLMLRRLSLPSRRAATYDVRRTVRPAGTRR